MSCPFDQKTGSDGNCVCKHDSAELVSGSCVSTAIVHEFKTAGDLGYAMDCKSHVTITLNLTVGDDLMLKAAVFKDHSCTITDVILTGFIQFGTVGSLEFGGLLHTMT